jgi:hypothetical protein
MKRLSGMMAAGGLLALVAASTAQAAVLHTQWNFNTAIGANNAPVPSIGSGSATPVGMNSNANGADILAVNPLFTSTDPALPNNAWRVRGSVNNGWSGTTQLLSGARFNVSTAGVTGVVVRFDLLATDGSPRHGQFQYTTDGTSFTSFGGLVDFNATFDKFTTLSYDLSAIAAVNNNSLFGFQIVSAFSPVAFTNANGLQAANTAFQRANAGSQVYTGGAGNWRFDMVTVVVPEPSSLALLGLTGLAAVRRRRV